MFEIKSQLLKLWVIMKLLKVFQVSLAPYVPDPNVRTDSIDPAISLSCKDSVRFICEYHLGFLCTISTCSIRIRPYY